MFPQVGVAMTELLTRLGVEVTFNPEQTCCGQPAFNTGYQHEAREVATRMLNLFERELETADYIVTPSGSCASMIKKFYAELFSADAELRARACRVGERLFELSQFIVDVLGTEDVGASFRKRVTYHDSCHLLRELGVSSAPRKLIKAVRGIEFVEMVDADKCCGFGGTFSVKYPEISVAITEEKVFHIERSGAEVLIACDSSCLMQTAGLLSRHQMPIRCLHIAELLVSREP
jgi:L-lactate dehydrogenase complex protein LldE